MVNELRGIDEIMNFTGKSAVTLLGWRRDFSFPMVRQDAVWVSSESQIRTWFEERHLNPATATNSKLQAFELKSRVTDGENPINRSLKGSTEICKFLSINLGDFQDLIRYEGCPVHRKDSVYYADGDELEKFCIKQRLKVRINPGVGVKKNG